MAKTRKVVYVGGYDTMGFPIDGRNTFFERGVPFDIAEGIAEAMIKEKCGFVFAADDTATFSSSTTEVKPTEAKPTSEPSAVNTPKAVDPPKKP